MIAPTTTTTQRGRLYSRAATLAGAVLMLATLVALIAFGRNEYLGLVRSELQRAELQARVLEDHAIRSVDSVSVLLGYLTEQLDPADLAGQHLRTDALLDQSLVALPYLRSLSVVDATGQVLASSNRSDTGLRIDLARLGRIPAPGKETLGGYTPGRGLDALVPRADAPPPRPGVGFIPLVRAQNQRALYLVALINPDSLASYQVRTLDSPTKKAYLLSYQGEVLAATGPSTEAPGARLTGHPVLRDYLPAIEHGSFVGPDGHGERQLIAFRLSHSRPLVVVVEQPHAILVGSWLGDMRWFAVAAALVIGFLAGMTLLARRSLRAREVALEALDVARLSG